MNTPTSRLDFGTTLFGARSDVLVFLAIPIGLAALIGVIASMSGTSIYDIQPWSFFVVYALFDFLHVYLGIGIATGFREEFAKRPRFYLVVPILCFLIYSSLLFKSQTWFLMAFAYASVFHVGRQQIGWMRASERRGKTFFSRENLLSDAAIYASTFGFVFYKVVTHPHAQWSATDDLGHLPILPGSVILAAIAAINFAYLSVQVLNFTRHGYFNVTKNLVWLSTLVIWGVAFCAFGDFNVVSLALIAIHHATPFILLAFLYARKRTREGYRTWWPSSGPLVFGGLAVMALALALFEFVAMGIDELFWLPPLLATASTFHYAIDTIFWRERNNPGCLRF